MERQEIMQVPAEWFGIEPDDDGEYDIGGYDWQAGCYMGNGSGRFLNLAEVVRCLEMNL